MSFFEDLRDIRNGKIRADFGDKVVKYESWLCAVVVFGLLFTNGVNVGISIICGLAIGIVIPILMATIKIFAKIAAIIFSLIWAYFAAAIAALISSFANDGAPIAIIVVIGAIIGFAISFFAHRVFAQIGFVPEDEPQIIEVLVTTCTNCGAEVEPDASFCSKCGTKFTD